MAASHVALCAGCPTSSSARHGHSRHSREENRTGIYVSRDLFLRTKEI